MPGIEDFAGGVSASVITYSPASLTGLDSSLKRCMLNLFACCASVSKFPILQMREDESMVILIGTGNGFTQLGFAEIRLRNPRCCFRQDSY